MGSSNWCLWLLAFITVGCQQKHQLDLVLSSSCNSHPLPPLLSSTLPPLTLSTFPLSPPLTFYLPFLTLLPSLTHHRMMSLPTCTHWLYDQTTHTKSRLTTSVWREVAWKTTGTSFRQKPFPTQRPRSQKTGMTPGWLTTPKTQSRRSVVGSPS